MGSSFNQFQHYAILTVSGKQTELNRKSRFFMKSNQNQPISRWAKPLQHYTQHLILTLCNTKEIYMPPKKVTKCHFND